MPITHFPGGTTFTGDSIQYHRLLVLRGAVQLELAGIRVRKGRVIWKQVAKEFNIKGNKKTVYDWLDTKINELRPLQQHIDKGL